MNRPSVFCSINTNFSENKNGVMRGFARITPLTFCISPNHPAKR